MDTKKLVGTALVVLILGSGCDASLLQKQAGKSCPLKSVVTNGAHAGALGRTDYVCTLSNTDMTGMFYALYDDGTAYFDEVPRVGGDPFPFGTWELNEDDCSISIFEGSIERFRIHNATLKPSGVLNTVESLRLSDETVKALPVCYYDLSPGV